MLKADVKRFQDLASPDEAVSSVAAKQLQKLEPGHLWKHPVGAFRFSPEQVKALVSNWRGTTNDLLRSWIAQALVMAVAPGFDVLEVLAGSAHLDGPYMHRVVAWLSDAREYIPGGNDLIRGSHRHQDAYVRSRVAEALRDFGRRGEFDRVKDGPILHKLLLDTHGEVRSEAVLTLSRLPGLDASDYEVLLEVANVDGGTTRDRARELIAQLEQTVPGCTPSAFAAREPLLRTDGVYVTEMANLDVGGIWISSGCLRFFESGKVHYFGTDVPPVNFDEELPREEPTAALEPVRKKGARLSFSVMRHDGRVDYAGRVDGQTLHLRAKSRETGGSLDQTFNFVNVDRNAEHATAAAPRKRASRKKGATPFVAVRPRSLLPSHAKKWYLWMVARLPGMLEDTRGNVAKVALAWTLKNDMRNAAARSLLDPGFKKEFLSMFPLPTLASVQKFGPAVALETLLTLTRDEMRAFGTSDPMGSEFWDGRRHWIVTDEGWTLSAKGALGRKTVVKTTRRLSR